MTSEYDLEGPEPTGYTQPGPARGYELTLLDAARACGVHKNTIRRHLRAGRFPNARRSGPGQNAPWLVPAADLEAAGLRPHRPSAPDPELTAPPASADRIVTLERELGEERERRKGAEALAHERLQRVEDLRQTLRLLEAGTLARTPEPLSPAEHRDLETLDLGGHRERERPRQIPVRDLDSERRQIPVRDLDAERDAEHHPNLLEAGVEFADALARAFLPRRRR